MATSELCCPRFNTEDFSQREINLQLISAPQARIQIETATVPGSAYRLNEDSLDFRNHPNGKFYAGVFDGTSSLKPIPALIEKDITTARFASHFLAHEMPMAIGSNLRTTFTGLNRRLRRRVINQFGVDFSDPGLLPASTGTAVSLDFDRSEFEMAHVGDSFCLVEYTSGESEVLTDNRNKYFDQRTINLLNQIALERGITPKEAKSDQRIKDELICSFREKMNNPNLKGIGIFNGDPNMGLYIKHLRLPLDRVKSILLATDGMILADTDLEKEEDANRLMQIATEKGLRHMVGLKRELEESDPDWVKYPRLKESDDATGILILINRSRSYTSYAA